MVAIWKFMDRQKVSLLLRQETTKSGICWGDVLKEKKVAQGKVRIEVVAPVRQAVGPRAGRGRGYGPARGNPRPIFALSTELIWRRTATKPTSMWRGLRTWAATARPGVCPMRILTVLARSTCPSARCTPRSYAALSTSRLRQQVEIKPGQNALTLKVKRAFDMKRRGYYSGDTHVHFLSSQSSHLEAEGEDLNVVHLLASQWGRLFTSWEEFTGGLAPTSSDNHLVWVSQENRQHVLGHISLLGLKEFGRADVYRRGQ